MSSGKLAKMMLGQCVDCQRPFLVRDDYLVRGSVWTEAGMGGWETGFLHMRCLEARLGRKLTPDDMLARYTGLNAKGDAIVNMHPDYYSSPEFLERPGVAGRNWPMLPTLTVPEQDWRTIAQERAEYEKRVAINVLRSQFVKSGKLTAKQAKRFGMHVDDHYAYVPKREAKGWILLQYAYRFEVIKGKVSLCLEPPKGGAR